MRANERGFTLIELISVVILISIISVTLFSRLGNIQTANLQASRDDLIAALFFAQQTAMARSGIQLVLTGNSVSVTENGSPIVVHSQGYPLNFPTGISSTSGTFTYLDKLGQTNSGVIVLSNTTGQTVTITVEASGYAH